MFIHLLFLVLIVPGWNYDLKTCCSSEKTTRLLSCPLNFMIKLRSVIFHAGNGCAPSSCQRRLNKHYLLCNAHRTCSINIECLPMDCLDEQQWNATVNQSEYLSVEYDCHLHPVEKIVLFSAQVNIESPPEEEEEEEEWKDYLWKKFLLEREEINPSRPLFTDVFRTVLILFVFAGLLLVPMLVTVLVYKRVKSRRQMRTNKHQPFPADDDAYDNLKNSPTESLNQP